MYRPVARGNPNRVIFSHYPPKGKGAQGGSLSNTQKKKKRETKNYLYLSFQTFVPAPLVKIPSYGLCCVFLLHYLYIGPVILNNFWTMYLNSWTK